MTKYVESGDSDASAAGYEIVHNGAGPALRVRNQGGGNAIEVVGPGGLIYALNAWF